MAGTNINIVKRRPWNHLVRDIRISLVYAKSSISFIKEYRLWQGINQYRWLSKLLVLLAVLVGISFIKQLLNWYHSSDTDELGILGSASGVLSSIWENGQQLFVLGSYRYVMLFLIEVLVFHFVRRALMITTGEDIDTRFRTFLSCQYRMLGVTLFCIIMEYVTSTLLNIPLRILSLGVLSPLLFAIVQAYYTGIIIIDNYNEVYHMNIKQSYYYCWQYGGVTLIVGGIVAVLMLIPVIGVLVGPIFGSVVAARTMHDLYLKDQDRAWVYTKYSKKIKDTRRVADNVLE